MLVDRASGLERGRMAVHVVAADGFVHPQVGPQTSSRSAPKLARGERVLEIQVGEIGGCTICRPVGELDAFTVSQFRRTVSTIASKPRLVVDLNRVPFVDSAGLGALIGGIRRVHELGGEVMVACSQAVLNRLLHTTGVDRIVTVTASAEEAAEAMSSLSEPNPPGRSVHPHANRRKAAS
jgi:anti-sigma B factor antagonist